MTLLTSIFQRQLVSSPSRRGKCRIDDHSLNAPDVSLQILVYDSCVCETTAKRKLSFFLLQYSALPVDFALDTFKCVKEDEYLVQRREVGTWNCCFTCSDLPRITLLTVMLICKTCTQKFIDFVSHKRAKMTKMFL